MPIREGTKAVALGYPVTSWPPHSTSIYCGTGRDVNRKEDIPGSVRVIFLGPVWSLVTGTALSKMLKREGYWWTKP